MAGPKRPLRLILMAHHRLQRISVSGFSAWRRLWSLAKNWIMDRPALAAWVYPSAHDMADARYREFNDRYFASYFEQERMLADKPRMKFYHEAVARHIQPQDRVIDLGTGTGILAAFASRRGAAKVYAIDHSKILETAKTLAKHNEIQNVEFVATHSKEFSLDQKVDVIVHEQMGDCLFDEAMVANVTDLRDRLLKPGGLILPSRFELYCEPIQVRDQRVVPFIWELNVHGFDYGCLAQEQPADADYYRFHSCDLGVVSHFLGQPEPVLSIDLHTINESEMQRDLRFSRVVTRAGRLDGLAIYFTARVDDDLELTSDPMNEGRAPHWGFRILRSPQSYYEVGDIIDVCLSVERWPVVDSWHWTHVKRAPQSNPAPLPASRQHV